MRKCSAITFIWDNCCHFTCPVLWRESTMNLMFVQFLAIFSLVKISTTIANNNGWSIDNPTETFTKMYFFQLHKPTRCNRQRGKAFAKAGWIYLSCLEQIFSLKSTFRLGRTLFLSSGPKQMSLTTLIILWSTGLCLLFGFHLWLDMICRDHTCVSVHFYILSLRRNYFKPLLLLSYILSFIILDRPDQAEKDLVLWPIEVHWKLGWRDLHLQYGRLHSCRGHSLSRFLIFSCSEHFKRW